MQGLFSIAAVAALLHNAVAVNVCPALSSQLLKFPVAASVVSKDCSSFLRATVTPALVYDGYYNTFSAKTDSNRTVTQTKAVTITTFTQALLTTVSTDVRSSTVSTVTLLDEQFATSTLTFTETATVSNVETQEVSVTLPATVTQFAKRAAATPKTPPKYASKVSGLYSMACTCIGVKPCTTTLSARSTTTTVAATSYAIASAPTTVTATTIVPLTASTILTTTVTTETTDVEVTETATVDVTTLLTQTVTVPVSTVRICSAATPTFSVMAESSDPAFQYNGKWPTDYDPSNKAEYGYIIGWIDDSSKFKFFLDSGMLYQRFDSGSASAPLYIDDEGGDDSYAGVIEIQSQGSNGNQNLQCALSPFDGVRQTLQCSTAGGESVFYWCPSGKGVAGFVRSALCLFSPQDSRATGCQVITLTAVC